MTFFDRPAVGDLDHLGPLLQRTGIALEDDPTAWAPLWENDLLRAITLIEVPDPYNPVPNCGGAFGKDPAGYGLQVAIAERIARHDASCVLALPTPTMSGYAIRVLGHPDQIDRYFKRYLKQPKRSFFAITEPQVGSDATAGTSRVADTLGGRRLTGHKKLVGSAAQADFGLIFARDDRTNSHKLVMCDSAAIAQMQITRLPMQGLAGADFTEIIVDDLPVTEQMILGHGLNRGLRDGFFAMNSVFDRYRPVVSALAIGSARGLLDTLLALGVARSRLEAWLLRHAVCLDRLSEIADAYEAGKPKVHETSRLKLDAIAFLDDVVSLVFRVLPVLDIVQTPGLLKRCRDAKSYEYMEGTSHVHLLKAFRSFAASA